MRDQQFVDDAVENPQTPPQTKAELAPKTILPRGTRRVMLLNLRRCLDAFIHVAREVVAREWHELSNRRFVIDLDKTIGELRLAQSQYFIKTSPQTLFGALVRCITLAKTMNHRTFQRRREIGGRFGCLGVVPHGHLIGRGQLEDAIEIILARAALIIDQLRHAETVNRVMALWAERFYERKRLVQRVGRVRARLRWLVAFGL